MPEPTPPQVPVPDLGAMSDDARLSLALHALAEVRQQLQGAQRTLAGSIAELSALGEFDGERDPRSGAA